MLKRLYLSNFILIEEISIDLQKGFHILTGESGSGKSTIILALCHLLGDRAEADLIRLGANTSILEALFDIDALPYVQEQLSHAGVPWHAGEELIIRREIKRHDKSRVYINNVAVPLGFLKQLCRSLLQIVGQHANRLLIDTNEQRKILDCFGGLEAETADFRLIFEKRRALEKELEALVLSQEKTSQVIEEGRLALEELHAAGLKEGEEEELLSEYSRLIHVEELMELSQSLNSSFTEPPESLLLRLREQKKKMEILTRFDSTFQESLQAFQNSLIEIEEVSYTVQRMLDRLENNPTRIKLVEERLALIASLKKKYGATYEEMQKEQERRKEELFRLEEKEWQLEALQKKVEEIKNQESRLAHDLSQKRKKWAQALEKAVSMGLEELNLRQARFRVFIQAVSRTAHGDEEIEFFFTPNLGEGEVAVKDGACGGELSRLLLVLKSLLAGKEQVATLIFDEIDANIGGETAILVGRQLKKLGEERQLLCVSHFPQVAREAHHHLHIAKREEKGRTFATLSYLDGSRREAELQRMRGDS